MADFSRFLVYNPHHPPIGHPISLDWYPPHPDREERVAEAKAEGDIYRRKSRAVRRKTFDYG